MAVENHGEMEMEYVVPGFVIDVEDTDMSIGTAEVHVQAAGFVVVSDMPSVNGAEAEVFQVVDIYSEVVYTDIEQNFDSGPLLKKYLCGFLNVDFGLGIRKKTHVLILNDGEVNQALNQARSRGDSHV